MNVLRLNLRNKDEREHIKALAKREDLLVVPADKGKEAVIMDMESFKDKLRVMLQDGTVYKKLKKDLTAK